MTARKLFELSLIAYGMALTPMVMATLGVVAAARTELDAVIAAYMVATR